MKRNELERQVRKIMTGCEGCTAEDPCIYCMVCAAALDDAVRNVMDAFDRHLDTVLSDLSGAYEGLWTAWEVADYLGAEDDNSARARLSRAGIRSVRTMAHPTTKRPMALYLISEVRAKLTPRKAVTR
jgi:hypothetical protein